MQIQYLERKNQEMIGIIHSRNSIPLCLVEYILFIHGGCKLLERRRNQTFVY